MERLRRDEVLCVLSFLNLDEWIAFRRISKTCLSQIGGSLLCWIKQQCKQRIDNRLANLGVDLNFLYASLQETKGAITGSFLIEILLGKDRFSARDIDLFIPIQATRDDWQAAIQEKIIGKHLYTLATGFEWKENANITREDWDKIAQSTRTPDDQGEVDCLLYESWLANFQNKIHSINTYIVQETHFQLIYINTNQSAQNYIDTHFDFRCCQGTYDGANIRLPKLGDLVSRTLVPTSQMKSKVELLDERSIKTYHKRLEKYEQRGFLLSSNVGLRFGRYSDVKVDKIPKEILQQCKTFQMLASACRIVQDHQSYAIDIFANSVFAGLKKRKREEED